MQSLTEQKIVDLINQATGPEDILNLSLYGFGKQRAIDVYDVVKDNKISSLHDLTAVTGIGNKTIAKIKQLQIIHIGNIYFSRLKDWQVQVHYLHEDGTVDVKTRKYKFLYDAERQVEIFKTFLAQAKRVPPPSYPHKESIENESLPTVEPIITRPAIFELATDNPIITKSKVETVTIEQLQQTIEQLQQTIATQQETIGDLQEELTVATKDLAAQIAENDTLVEENNALKVPKKRTRKTKEVVQRTEAELTNEINTIIINPENNVETISQSIEALKMKGIGIKRSATLAQKLSNRDLFGYGITTLDELQTKGIRNKTIERIRSGCKTEINSNH